MQRAGKLQASAAEARAAGQMMAQDALLFPAAAPPPPAPLPRRVGAAATFQVGSALLRTGEGARVGFEGGGRFVLGGLGGCVKRVVVVGR